MDVLRFTEKCGTFRETRIRRHILPVFNDESNTFPRNEDFENMMHTKLDGSSQFNKVVMTKIAKMRVEDNPAYQRIRFIIFVLPSNQIVYEWFPLTTTFSQLRDFIVEMAPEGEIRNPKDVKFELKNNDRVLMIYDQNEGKDDQNLQSLNRLAKERDLNRYPDTVILHVTEKRSDSQERRHWPMGMK